MDSKLKSYEDQPGSVYDKDEPKSFKQHQLKALENSGSNSQGQTSSTSANNLSNAETTAGSSANNATGSQNINSGGFWNAKGGTTKRGSRLAKSLANKKMLLIGGGGAAGLLVLLIIFFIFLSTLLIPGLAQDILTYEFARVERQLSQDTTEDLAGSAEIQSAADDATTSAELTTDFSNDSFFQSLKNLNTDNFIANLEDQGLLQYNYETVSGLRYLDSITVGGKTISIPDNSLSKKITHPIENFSDNVQFADDLSSSLEDVYPNSGIGVIIRGRFVQAIMDDIKAPRFAWLTSKFKGKNGEQADLEQQTEAQQATDPEGDADDGSLDATEQKEIDDAQSDIAKETNSANAATTYADKGISPAVKDDINAAASDEAGGAFDKTLSIIDEYTNPAYAILLPVCIVYDGSILSPNAQQTINTNTDEDENSFFYLEAAADQQKSGDTNSAAVGAFNAKLGNNIENSVPMERANGQTVSTSQGMVSPQTAGNGQYTAFTAFAPSLAPVINPSLDFICPIITNPYIAAAGAAAQVAGIFDGQDEEEAAAAAPILAEKGPVERAILSIVSRVTNSLGVDAATATKTTSITSKLIDIFPDTKDVTTIAGIVGLDWVVRIGTAMKMGMLNDGLSQGADYANQADAGANLTANQDMQQQFYGEPLSSTQVAYNNVKDQQYIADSYKRESLYDRYISPDNPNSLVAKVGLDIYGDINKSFIPNFIASVARIFSPASLVNRLALLLGPNTKVAADTEANNDDADYGIVQWGYTQQEENLISGNSSYQPLQNEAILNQYSTQVQQIAATYKPCFTLDMSVLLTSDPSQGPGGTTSEPYIVRDDEGNVTGGLCSDEYLGVNSADPNAQDASNDTADLVFRWRLQQAYENTSDTLTGLANASASTANSSTSFNVQGAEQLAKQDSVNGTSVGLALYDSNGDQIANYNDTSENYGASITKAMILVAYLNQVGSGTLSSEAETNLTSMIENSDDASANWVYSQLSNGPAEIQAVATQAGMTGFKFDASDPLYVLGQSQITAEDFAKFFANINNYINSTQRVFGMNLLANLSSADHTGLLLSGLPGTVYSKEGWKPEPDTTNPFGDEGEPYTVNQAAQFTDNGTTYGIAVTVGGTANQTSGEQVIESIVSSLMQGATP